MSRVNENYFDLVQFTTTLTFSLLRCDKSSNQTFSALVTGLVEVLAISWVYGVDRFLEDIRRMIGWTGLEPFYKLHRIYWTWIWKVVTPTLLLVILVASAIEYKPMSYGDVIFPGWANGLGWVVSGVSVLCIPTVMVVKIFFHGGWRVISKENR